MSSVPDAIIATAIAAADLARTVTMRYFRSDLAIENKQDASPVTLADRETEAAIRQLILENHPDHGFFGEESGNQLAGEEWRWIVDPIDGTKSYATGKPTFGTLISVVKDDAPVIGIIDHAALNERWVGISGKTTTFNDKPCVTSATATLADATAYCTTIDMFDGAAFQLFNQLTTACRYRAFGGDCYCYGLLAAGFTDIVCEADLKPYDFMALIPVIEGAGGIISDWQGQRLTLNSGDRVLASANQRIHALALGHLASA